MQHTSTGWLSSTGKIKYDPYRGKMKRKTEWWAVLNVDREITRYYRWWVQRRYHITLCDPSWDAHISIIRGEKPSKELMHLWKKYDGQEITFKYKHHVRRSGDRGHTELPNFYWFVEIDCPFLVDIRKEMNRPVDWKLHLTVGRTYY